MRDQILNENDVKNYLIKTDLYFSAFRTKNLNILKRYTISRLDWSMVW